MTQQAKTRDYSNTIKRLKSEGVQSGLSEEEFKQIYHESLQELQQNLPLRPHRTSIIRKYKYIIIATILATLIIWNFKSVYSMVVCNLQEYIYPGLRLLRKLSLPFISLFPSLSGELCINSYESAFVDFTRLIKLETLTCRICDFQSLFALNNSKNNYNPDRVNALLKSMYYLFQNCIMNLVLFKTLFSLLLIWIAGRVALCTMSEK